jgi:hypothetical protein
MNDKEPATRIRTHERQDRNIRFFISSKFRDIDVERDHLVAGVVPELYEGRQI